MGSHSKVAAALIVSGLLLLVCGAVGRQASANAFQGNCPTAAPVVCTLDEPEGNNAATHGTITVTRVGPVFTFTPSFNPGAGLASGSDPVQLCMVENSGQDNPYVPTNANTCAGSHGDPTKFQSFPVVFDATSLLATPDAEVWFALHVNIQDGGGRTTYVVGGVGGGSSGTTTTTGCDVPVSRVARVISTSGCTSTTTVAATTTTAIGPTTTLPPTTTTVPPTTSTLAPTTTSAPSSTTTLPPPTTTTVAPTTTTAPSPTTTLPPTTTTVAPSTTTTGQATTTTTEPATTTTTTGALPTTTGRVSATTITSPRVTPTIVGARVLGVVFEAPAGDPAVVGTLPRTGTATRTLLLLGATLLCLGVWLFLLSARRSPRGAHR